MLAHDGKGTNILTNLQNYDFVIDEQLAVSNLKGESLSWKNPFLLINFILLLFLAFDRIRAFIKSNFKSLISSILRVHDKQLHAGVNLHNDSSDSYHDNLPNNQPGNPPTNLPTNSNDNRNP